jgi:hypothetical protein
LKLDPLLDYTASNLIGAKTQSKATYFKPNKTGLSAKDALKANKSSNDAKEKNFKKKRKSGVKKAKLEERSFQIKKKRSLLELCLPSLSRFQIGKNLVGTVKCFLELSKLQIFRQN